MTMNKLVNSIAKMVESNEKMALPILSVKLNKLAEIHPHDQTILGMANVISKMSGTFISLGQFKNLYNKMYSRNSKFAEYFKDELGETLSSPTIVEKNELPIADLSGFGDPVLSSALNSAFGNPQQILSKEAADKAKKTVAVNLDNWNLKASKLEIASGNDKFIVIKADYDTPKGITSVLVPVEIKNNKVLEPSMFMCNAGPQDLNHINLKNYLLKNAGAKLQVKANDMIEVLTNAVSEKREISDAELILTKLNAAKEKASSIGQITGVKTEEFKNDVSIPKTAEVDLFEKKFSTASGIAGFVFGQDKINLGRDVIARNLSNFGLKNAQINVLNCDDKTVFYAVAVNAGRTAFKVPVKFENNRLITPDVILCNGSAMPFTKQSLNTMMVLEQSDIKMATFVSPQYELKSEELINNVKSAMQEDNLAKAEDALSVLQEKDAKAYAIAFNIYINGLSSKKEAETSCSLIVKNASSKYSICGHTGLPTHKVFQDEHGNCHPMYRKISSNPSINSKIFGSK